MIGTGLSATAAVCSAAASNRCTVAPNLANLTGAGVTLPSLASGQFYEISVTANVSGSGSVINSAQIRLPASNIASNTGASCVTSGGITRSFNTTTGACTSTDTDSIVVLNAALQCQSNMYALQGNTTNGFRNIVSLSPTGALGASITTVPTNGTGTGVNNNAGLAISPDGTKVFVTTPQNTLRVYDVPTNTWVAEVPVPSGNRGIRATVTSNGIGYLGSENLLWEFQTSAPYTVSNPRTITSLNGGPSLLNTNGDFFSDDNGNLFVSANPLADGTTLNLYRVAANGNALFLGSVASPSGQYGGYAALTSGIYASAVSGVIIRPDLINLVATQTAAADPTRGNSDLASCFYPNLNPVIQSLKTSTKVAGSAGAQIVAGDTLEYRIVIRNIGTLSAANVQFQDSIPAGTTYVPNSTTYNYTTATGRPQVALADVGGVMPFVTARAVGSPTAAAGVLLVDQTGAGTMATDAAQRDREVVITFRVTVNANASVVSNRGFASYISDPGPPTTTTVGTDDPTTPEPNDATVTTITQNADLSITKTNNVTSVSPASATSYNIVVTNAGPSAANGALFADPAATGLSKTSVTCTAAGGAVCPTAPISIVTVEGATGIAIPTLPSGGTVTFTVNANVTATSGSVANTATVTAPAGTTEINTANNTATDTDTVNALVNITGRVFTDNSGTTAVAANAYNGLQNAGELGIAGSTVELNNCSGSVIATTQTDAAGDYSFAVTAAQLSSPNFCITQTNLTGYSSVSGTTGYVRATDTITVAKTAALTYPNHNFGDARLNLILTSDGQQTTTPSGTVSYPHILRSDSVLTVGALTTVVTESPTLGWTSVLYRDNNCNGTIEASELPLTAALGVLLPNQDVCVVQRVNAPATASNGAQHVASLSASYTATAQDGGVLSGSSNTRTDTTLVGTAGLDMRKQVRVVEQCLPTVIAGVEPFTDRNTAQNGDFLEYEIIYTNRSTRSLSQLTVRDVAPSSTTFKSAACQSTPSGSSCTAPVTAGVNGDLAWSLANIAPAATGSVRFCVQVPPLAAPPIK